MGVNLQNIKINRLAAFDEALLETTILVVKFCILLVYVSPLKGTIKWAFAKRL